MSYGGRQRPFRYGEGGRGPPSPQRHRPHPHRQLLPLRRDGDAAPFHRHHHHETSGYGRASLHHPALLEEQLHFQHRELQRLLVDNQRLAATHVALKQELQSAQYDLQNASHTAKLMNDDHDAHFGELHAKFSKMEMELRAAEAQRVDLLQMRGDIEKLSAARQELLIQVQSLTQEIASATSDLQPVPAIKTEIEETKQELAKGRSAIEYEKRAFVAAFEQGQIMEKKLVSVAREVEKLRTELANAEKRSQATAAGLPGSAYGGNYGNPESGYGGGGPYASYGTNTVQGAPGSTGQYGSGHASWNAYDMQKSRG